MVIAAELHWPRTCWWSYWAKISKSHQVLLWFWDWYGRLGRVAGGPVVGGEGDTWYLTEHRLYLQILETLLDISDIPLKVEIHGSTVSMALTSKPTSEEKSEDSYLLFVFFVYISDIDTILYFQNYGWDLTCQLKLLEQVISSWSLRETVVKKYC